MPLELFKTFTGNEVAVAVVVAVATTLFMILTGGSGSGGKKVVVNPGIKKSEPKVVDAFSVADIEDMVKKNKDGVVALCRCWRSSTFPLCDGTHNSFNKTCGENVGPLLIKKKK